MLHNILYDLKWAIALIITTIILFFVIALLTIKPAIATITEKDIAPGQIHCRSEQVLKDETGHKWQVMLFTQVNPTQEFASLNLRLSVLSGYPHLQSRKPLIINTPNDRYEAPDIFLGKSPLPSIGQYEVKNILLKLPTEELSLEIPIENNKSTHLNIPKAVVKEWHEVAAKNAGLFEKLPSDFPLAC